MIVLDTSAWIEWIIDSPLSEQLTRHLPEQADWLVPTMVQLERAKWLSRENGGDRADQVIAYTRFCQVAPLDSIIALGAAEASRIHRLTTADAVIFATAQAYEAHILTFERISKDFQTSPISPRPIDLARMLGSRNNTPRMLTEAT